MKLKYEIWKKKEAEKKAYLEKKEQERLDTIAEANAIRERRCQVHFVKLLHYPHVTACSLGESKNCRIGIKLC